MDSSTNKIEQLKNFLLNLGLEIYFDKLCKEGFETKDDVVDLIEEKDLEEMGFKIAHKKKLLLARDSWYTVTTRLEEKLEIALN